VEKIGACDFLSVQLIELLGERGRTRTCDPCLKRALLYQLSYAPISFKILLHQLGSWLIHCTFTAH
jgi:hypothetical protein